MASDAESSSSKSKSLEDTPFVDYAVHQAQLYQRTIEDAVESAIATSKLRLSQIRSTSIAHFNQTLDLLQDVKSEYSAYENIFFGKIKEGVHVAASNPLLTCGVAAGLSLLVLKKPRSFLYYSTVRLFMNEEALLSRADARVKEMRKSIDLIKTESERLEAKGGLALDLLSSRVTPTKMLAKLTSFEKSALHAEEEFIRGRTKLRHAGKQIQGAIQSAYKIERQAGGLKDIVAELPRREASRFKAQVSKLAAEVKRERNALSKEVSKISNYGISV